MQASQSPVQVRTRRVMYIPGYDPVPPRKYRERYRREAARQAQISGYEIALAKKTSDARFGWRVEARIDGAETAAEVEVMYWADIVRGSMAQGILGTYWQLVRTAWAYIGSGALWRLMRLRKGPVIAALYPVVVLLGQLALALGLGFVAGYAFHALTEQLLRWIEGPGFPAQSFWVARAWIGMGVVLPLTAWLILHWSKRRDPLLAWYLMHDYAFSARLGGAYPPLQEARMAEFRARIAQALTSDADEVLIVGHSSGAYIAISILADLIRAGQVPANGPTLSLLTLGHVVPMVSFLPKATRLRADLAYLSTREELNWVDVTAPGDGCSFALCDPVAVSGVAPEGKRWPLVLSAAYTQTLSPEMQARMKWQLFELHFQYLNAFDRPGDYDYFKITAGPQTLWQRFGHRAPSQSRIETPVNRYTDIAA